MDAERMTIEQIREAGLEALFLALGVGGMERFLELVRGREQAPQAAGARDLPARQAQALVTRLRALRLPEQKN